MASFEEETYSAVFTSLKHPIRRKILRILSTGPKSFSELQKTLGLESPHLTYHLDGLTSLLAKTENGDYVLSSLGRIAVSTMKQVEEPSGSHVRTELQPRFWRHERTRFLALGIMCIMLSVGLVGALAYHVSTINSKDSTEASLTSQVTALQNRILLANSTIQSLNKQIAELENQLASNSSTVTADHDTITNLQSQVLTLQDQVHSLQILVNEMSSQNSTSQASSNPPFSVYGVGPTPGAPVYYSLESVPVSPLTNANASSNGLEVPYPPVAVGQTFTVDVHLRNATVTNVPAGVGGVQVGFDFADILSYCRPIGFTNMIGKPTGVFAGLDVIYGINAGFYDGNGNPVDPSNYDRATQYFVAVAPTFYSDNLTAGWNSIDGLVAKITFLITVQPFQILNQSTFYGQLQLKFTEIVDYNANEVPYSIIQGTLQIDADPTQG